MEANFKNTIEKVDATNGDIIRTLEKNFPAAFRQTKDFAKRFDAPTIEEVAENVWNFLKENMHYQADGSEHQKIRLPARLLSDKIGDCKSFALFAASILAHYTETGFRYSSYRNDPTPTHVYAIAKDEQGNTIIIDGVWHTFNDEKDFKHHKDHWMKISTLSGTANSTEVPKIAIDEYTYHSLDSWEKVLKASPKGSAGFKEATKHVNEILSNIGLDKKGIKRAQSMAGIGKHHWWEKYTDKVHSVLKGAWHMGKHLEPHVSAMRNAFLGLVDINYRGFGSRITEQIQTGNTDELKKLWEDRFGGNFDRLVNAARRGAKHKPFLGRPKRIKGTEEAIGFAPALIPAILATAAPLLALIAKLIPAGQSVDDAGEPDPNSPNEDAGFGDEVPRNTREPLSLFKTILEDGKPVIKEIAQLFNPQDQSGATDLHNTTPAAKESGISPLVGFGIAGTLFFLLKKKK